MLQIVEKFFDYWIFDMYEVIWAVDVEKLVEPFNTFIKSFFKKFSIDKSLVNKFVC